MIQSQKKLSKNNLSYSNGWGGNINKIHYKIYDIDRCEI